MLGERLQLQERQRDVAQQAPAVLRRMRQPFGDNRLVGHRDAEEALARHPRFVVIGVILQVVAPLVVKRDVETAWLPLVERLHSHVLPRPGLVQRRAEVDGALDVGAVYRGEQHPRLEARFGAGVVGDDRRRQRAIMRRFERRNHAPREEQREEERERDVRRRPRRVEPHAVNPPHRHHLFFVRLDEGADRHGEEEQAERLQPHVGDARENAVAEFMHDNRNRERGDAIPEWDDRIQAGQPQHQLGGDRGRLGNIEDEERLPHQQ